MSEKTQTINYAADGAERLEADLEMNVGKLYVNSGADKMFEGEFTCSIEEWQPVVSYNVVETVGKLSVHQSALQGKRRHWKVRAINEWDLRFGDQLPLDIVAEVNAGSADLKLSELPLRSLDLEMNGASAEVELVGSYPHLSRADFEMNAGRLNLLMNGAFPNLGFADLELNACKATLDLVGAWESSLDIAIEANASWLTVRLPRQVGVRIRTESSLTMVSPVGLKKQRAGVYVNEAFEASAVTLNLDIVANVGKLNLQIVDKLSVASV